MEWFNVLYSWAWTFNQNEHENHECISYNYHKNEGSIDTHCKMSIGDRWSHYSPVSYALKWALSNVSFSYALKWALSTAIEVY